MAYTTYYVVGPSSGWSDPTATEIKAGQLSGGGAATASGSEASLGASGTHTFATPASGLSSTVSYKIAFVASDGSTDSNVVVSEAIHKGTGALTIGATTASGSGTVAHTGTGALTTGATTASGVGVLSHTGTGALTVGSTTASGSGTVTSPGVITGTGALTTSSVTASGAGVIAHTGNGAILISDIVVSGAGVLSHNGTGAVTVGNTTASGVGGVVGTVTGTGSLTVSAITVEGTGSVTGATTLTADDLQAIWDVELETGYTAREMMRIMFAALAGKRAGLGTSTESYYDVATGTTVRISLTPDANGNGTPVVDGS